MDPLAPENRADPYPFYAWLREHDPIRHAADGSWIISRYADGAGLLRDPRLSPNPAWLREGAVRGAEHHPVRQVGTSLMMFLDPPDHTRLRSLVSKAFTPKVVEGMRPRIQALVDDLLDRAMSGRGEGELDTVASGEFDTAASGEFDTVASGEFDTVASGEFDTVASGEFDTVASGEFDTAASGEFDTVASGEFDTAASGEFDIVGDLGYPLPVAVICELLGVPAFDRDLFRRLSSDASRLLDGGALDPESQQRGIVAGMQLFQYFTDLVEQRRHGARAGSRPDPGPDLLTAMIAAEEAGDRLSHAELITTATLLFVAGHETTSNLIGNAMLALLRNPGELRRLRDDASLIRTAVEELLRYDSPVQFVARITTEDIEVGGQPIPKGEQLILVVGAMNRDPGQFADPDRLDIGRPLEQNRHLSFSGGPHFCLGASLARLEAQVAISSLLHRAPELELATAAPAYREHFVLRGVDELRVRFAG